MAFDEARAARQTCPIWGEYFGGSASLSQPQINWLLGKGIPPHCLGRDGDGGGLPIASAEVLYDGELLFDFAQDGEQGEVVLLVLARDRAGDAVDLVSFNPRSGRLATRFARSAILGEHSLHGSRFDGPSRLHRCIISWFRAGRDGAVVIDPRHAGRALLDAPGQLVIEDEAHGAEIKRVLLGTVDLSRLVIAEAA